MYNVGMAEKIPSFYTKIPPKGEREGKQLRITAARLNNMLKAGAVITLLGMSGVQLADATGKLIELYKQKGQLDLLASMLDDFEKRLKKHAEGGSHGQGDSEYIRGRVQEKGKAPQNIEISKKDLRKWVENTKDRRAGKTIASESRTSRDVHVRTFNSPN